MPYQFTSSGLNPSQNNSGQWLQLFMSLLNQPTGSSGTASGAQMSALQAGQGPLSNDSAAAWLANLNASVSDPMGTHSLLGHGFDISKYGVSTSPPQQQNSY